MFELKKDFLKKEYKNHVIHIYYHYKSVRQLVKNRFTHDLVNRYYSVSKIIILENNPVTDTHTTIIKTYDSVEDKYLEKTVEEAQKFIDSITSKPAVDTLLNKLKQKGFE